MGDPVSPADAKVGDVVIRMYKTATRNRSPIRYERRRVTRATAKRLEVRGLSGLQFMREGPSVPRGLSRLVDPTAEVMAELVECEAASAADEAERDRLTRAQREADGADALSALEWLRTAKPADVVSLLGVSDLAELWRRVRETGRPGTTTRVAAFSVSGRPFHPVPGSPDAGAGPPEAGGFVVQKNPRQYRRK